MASDPLSLLASECFLLALRDYRRGVRVGVDEEERGNEQELVFTVEAWVPRPPVLADDLSRTYDYRRLAAAVDEAIAAGPCRLQETLIERVASVVARDPLIRAVRVTSLKPSAQPGATGVSAQLLRLSDGGKSCA